MEFTAMALLVAGFAPGRQDPPKITILTAAIAALRWGQSRRLAAYSRGR